MDKADPCPQGISDIVRKEKKKGVCKSYDQVYEQVDMGEKN